MGRVTLSMTGLDAIVAMADGNPGAVQVLAKLLELDLFLVLHLDDMGIYGPDIWRAYKDVCGQSMETLVSKMSDRSIAKDLAALDGKEASWPGLV